MPRRRQPSTTFKQTPRTPQVTFQPQAYQGFQRGINTLANAVRPTLGPVPRLVAVEPVGPGDKRPELLDSAGLVARRVLQLADRDADTGAMFLRHMLWRQRERAGDGTATAAVIFQQIYNQGVTYVQAGGSAVRLRHHLERGLALLTERLHASAAPLAGRRQIASMAMALCHDEPLADMLAELFDVVSEDGAIEVRSGRGRELERQYVLGTFYKGKPLAEWVLSDQPTRRLELLEPAVLVGDLNLNDPAELAPLFRAIEAAGVSSLLLLAREASEEVLGFLHAARGWPHPCRIAVVKAPDAVTGQEAMLGDIAIATGARRLLRAAGDSLRSVRAQDLGRARRAWADEEFFGIVSGKGDPRALGAHAARLRAAIEHAEDPDVRQKLRDRLGRLLGGRAVLWVGGISAIAIADRKEVAQRTEAAVRAAIGRGAVAGGGAGLLALRPALREREAAARAEGDTDQAVAYRILARAIEEPARTIMWNAGYEPARWLARVDEAGPGYGLDALTGEVVPMIEAGIVDSAGVLAAALHSAVASAALALTVDVIVHTRLPELSFDP